MMREQIAAAFPLQLEQKNAWERLSDEPARWFMRFKIFCSLGRKRTVSAVYEHERQQKAEEYRAKGRPGEAWYGAARRWNWQARADAYDQALDDRKAEQAREIAARSPFTSRPYRIVSLNNRAISLERALVAQDVPVATYLLISKHLQELIHEIADEVSAWQCEMEQVSDAAALDAMQDMKRRIEERAREREDEEDERIDALIARAAAMDRLTKEMRGKQD